MNKIILSIGVITIAVIGAKFISSTNIDSISKVLKNTPGNNQKMSKITQRKVKKNLSDFVADNGIKKIKNAIKEKKLDKEKLAPILVRKLQSYNECISKKTCLNNTSGRFYDLRVDPIFLKVSNLLEGLNYISEQDPSLLEQIDTSFLNKIAAFENKSVFYSANIMIFKKGKESILSSITMAKNLETNLVTDYLKLLSSDTYMEDQELRIERNNLIKSYLSSGQHMQLNHTMNSLNGLSFDKNEVEEIKTTYCKLQIGDNNEAQQMLNYKFAKFVRKYEVDSEC